MNMGNHSNKLEDNLISRIQLKPFNQTYEDIKSYRFDERGIKYLHLISQSDISNILNNLSILERNLEKYYSEYYKKISNMVENHSYTIEGDKVNTKRKLNNLRRAIRWGYDNYVKNERVVTSYLLKRLPCIMDYKGCMKIGNINIIPYRAQKVIAGSYIPPKWNIETLVDDLLGVINSNFFLGENKNRLTAVERSFMFHFWFVTIHPFQDYNGRTARIVQNIMLRDINLPPSFLTKDEKNYYIHLLYEAQMSMEGRFRDYWKRLINEKVENKDKINLFFKPSKELRNFYSFLSNKLSESFGIAKYEHYKRK